MELPRENRRWDITDGELPGNDLSQAFFLFARRLFLFPVTFLVLVRFLVRVCRFRGVFLWLGPWGSGISFRRVGSGGRRLVGGRRSAFWRRVVIRRRSAGRAGLYSLNDGRIAAG